MKKFFLATSFLLLTVVCFSQRINRITLAVDGAASAVTIALDENVILNISEDGSLSSWGIDRYADRRLDNVPRQQLDTYTGRTENYNESSDEAFRGKIRYIGKTQITYFASFENKLIAGKIKSIGNLKFEYYDNYAEVGSQGKVKSIGQSNFTYYSSFENDAFKNKIKTAGPVTITYYSSVVDKAIAGKIKSLNDSQFEYFTSQDQVGLKGALKKGRQIQVIGGITFWVKN